MLNLSCDRALFVLGGITAASFVILGVTLHVLFGYSIPFSGNAFGSDDAFISFRYAENLLLGNGLVFNVGEKVEGYSNFLYTLLIVPGLIFGRDNIYIYSLALNCSLLVGCCFLLQRLINRHMGALPALVGGGLLALSPIMWANAATGLESMLMLFLVLCAWSLLDLDSVKPSLLYGVALVAILCRVDGFILPVLVVLYLWLDSRRSMAYKLALFVVLAMSIYTAARLFYYNDYISNTYHAKVTGDLVERLSWGLIFLKNNTQYNGVALLCALTIVCVAISKDLVRRHLFPLIYLAYCISYYIYIGGDIYYERFLLALIPIGIFFTLLLVVRLRKPLAMILILTIVLLAGMLVLLKDDRFSYQAKNYDMWENLGRFLRQAPPDFLLAIDAAGKVPYYSGLPTLDMLGLNDRHIGHREMPKQAFIVAHSKNDPDYVLSRKPQLIAAWIEPNLDLAWGMTSDKYMVDYKLKYLVNTLLDSKGRDIVDVQGMSAEEIESLIVEGYNYGVLASRDVLNRLPLAERALLSFPTLGLGASISHVDDTALHGWHVAELEHRWSAGKFTKVIFQVEPDVPYEGRFKLEFGSLGSQRISVLLNGQLLGRHQLDSWHGQIEFIFDSSKLNRNGANILEFKLPDARPPGHGDDRVLALAFRRLTLY